MTNLNETGETSNEQNLDWIPNLHPRISQGWSLMRGLAIMWIFCIISLIVIIWLWINFHDMPWQPIYFVGFGNVLFGSGVISIYLETVQAIFVNKLMIKFKLNFGRIKSYSWDQIEYVIIGFDNENYIWVRGRKDTFDFFVPKQIIEKIVKYYEQETGRKPEKAEGRFKLSNNKK